jgi:hypothetical protein
MLKAFSEDLRYAQTARLKVKVRLLSGDKLLKGVHEVQEEDNFVSLYSPEMLGGTDMTTMKVDGDLIESVTVTDAEW